MKKRTSTGQLRIKSGIVYVCDRCNEHMNCIGHAIGKKNYKYGKSMIIKRVKCKTCNRLCIVKFKFNVGRQIHYRYHETLDCVDHPQFYRDWVSQDKV
jgi:hypothetical protein